ALGTARVGRGGGSGAAVALAAGGDRDGARGGAARGWAAEAAGEGSDAVSPRGAGGRDRRPDARGESRSAGEQRTRRGGNSDRSLNRSVVNAFQTAAARVRRSRMASHSPPAGTCSTTMALQSASSRSRNAA